MTRAQARGHAHSGEAAVSELISRPSWTVTFPAADPPRLATVELGYRDAQRAGRLDALGRAMREGRLAPKDYERRVRRMRPIAGLKPLADPRVVLALVTVSGRDDWVFESGRSRPRRARRSR
ncbi:MAG: hypothetical protein ACYDAD_14505 [Acidimicrobiales bacterium]